MVPVVGLEPTRVLPQRILSFQTHLDFKGTQQTFEELVAHKKHPSKFAAHFKISGAELQPVRANQVAEVDAALRSEEHTSELQSH